MDYPQGERAITHHAGPVRIGGWLRNWLLLLNQFIFCLVLLQRDIYNGKFYTDDILLFVLIQY
jgi:hypothetical protein